MLASYLHCPVSIHDSWLRKAQASLWFRVLWFTTLGQARSVLECVTSIFVLRLTTLQWRSYAGLGQPCKMLSGGFVQGLLECFSQSLFSSLPEVLYIVKHNQLLEQLSSNHLFSSSFKLTPDLLFKIMHKRQLKFKVQVKLEGICPQHP